MKKVIIVFALCCVIIVQFTTAQIIEGSLENIKIESSSINGNLFGDNANQDVAVYLPPSYKTNTDKKYPVLYFLCGYYDKVEYWTQTGYFQGFKLKDNMDKLINEGAIKEMIVVIPNSFTFLEGSFFTNSKVNGDYEDFYTQELVNHININYRTIDTRDARGIAGHSMGGSGALDLSMKYPEIYCMAYGLCSGLLAPNWVDESPIFGDETAIRSSIDLFNSMEGMTKAEAHTFYINKINSLRTESMGWLTIFGYAYGTAFAGDSSLSAPYFKYPFTVDNDEIKTDSVALANWEDGFGLLPEKIEQYKENILSLKSYVLDYGGNDFFKYIVSGNNYYHELLDGASIPHSFIDNGGDHESKVKQQIETSILPLCSNTLEFDTLNLNSEAKILSFSIYSQVGDASINNQNRTINIELNENTNLSTLSPIIQTSLGANITPKSRDLVDFTSGAATFTVVSESGLTTEVWEVNISQQITSVKKIQNSNSMIYPNPVTNHLNISIETGNTIDKIKIYNETGKLVYVSKSEESIDTSNFETGVYIVNIQLQSGEVLTHKMIKK